MNHIKTAIKLVLAGSVVLVALHLKNEQHRKNVQAWRQIGADLKKELEAATNKLMIHVPAKQVVLASNMLSMAPVSFPGSILLTTVQFECCACPSGFLEP
jgi:hypothetical protein